MARLQILYDSLQEFLWFQSLDDRFKDIVGREFPNVPSGNRNVDLALAYDRPDIVLMIDDRPILVVERSEEVPSGHNVGQRFSRIVAAARAQAACFYMFPFAARKHGGATAGPRYVNLRLFRAMENLATIYGSPIISINWPVDPQFELVKGPEKDEMIRALVSRFLTVRMSAQHQSFEKSAEVIAARDTIIRFAATIKRRGVYDEPPPSVKILRTFDASRSLSIKSNDLPNTEEAVVYEIGMTYVRSDPYVGSAMLYDYLYARRSPTKRYRSVILVCPNITTAQWQKEAMKGTGNKSVRLFVEVADVIAFSNGYITKDKLVP